VADGSGGQRSRGGKPRHRGGHGEERKEIHKVLKNLESTRSGEEFHWAEARGEEESKSKKKKKKKKPRGRGLAYKYFSVKDKCTGGRRGEDGGEGK